MNFLDRFESFKAIASTESRMLKLFLLCAPYLLRGGNAPRFICSFWRYISCLCLFVYRPFSFLSSFFTFFFPYTFFLIYLLSFLLIYFFTYLSTSPEQAHSVFQARGCKRRPYLALAPYVLQGSNVPWFMYWFWHYINCLFVCLLNFLPPILPSSSSFLMLSLLLVYFLTYLSTSSRIDPFRFLAGGCRSRPNMAFVFLCVHFMLQYILLWMHVCFCCVSRDWLGRTSPKWPVLYRVGCKALTLSVIPGFSFFGSFYVVYVVDACFAFVVFVLVCQY